MRLIDISGQRFGRLLVVAKHPMPSKSGGSLWDCLCECGNTKVANASNLRAGSTISCGCAGKEWAKKLGSDPEFIAKRKISSARHGHKRKSGATVEYKTWLAMKRRCYDPSHKDYKNWGGRGIRVCERWNRSFDNFLEDMGLRPHDKNSIDRLDPLGDYSPDNCRWADNKEQGENRRTNIHVTYRGFYYPSLATACKALGIPLSRAMYRLKAGMAIEHVLSKELFSRWKPRP